MGFFMPVIKPYSKTVVFTVYTLVYRDAVFVLRAPVYKPVPTVDYSYVVGLSYVVFIFKRLC